MMEYILPKNNINGDGTHTGVPWVGESVGSHVSGPLSNRSLKRLLRNMSRKVKCGGRETYPVG